MSSLVALLSSGKGTWAELGKIIRSHDWDNIYLITNEFGMNTINKQENMEFILINPDDNVKSIKEAIMKGLKGKILDTEVAFNMVSGSGKEHMAALSSLLKLGLGIRLISIVDEKLTEL